MIELLKTSNGLSDSELNRYRELLVLRNTSNLSDSEFRELNYLRDKHKQGEEVVLEKELKRFLNL